MKRLLLLLLCVLTCVLASCATAPESAETTPAAPVDTGADATSDDTAAEQTTAAPLRDKEVQTSILFIGNSFTFYNDMPTKYFKNICSSAGYNVKIETITKGGHYLSEFADVNDEYGKKVDTALKNNKYDVVILQEQSGAPIAKPERFFGGVRDLAAKVKENGAELYLYETWGYKSGYSKLPSHGGTTKIMEMKLRAAYTAIAEEVGAEVILAGAAMLDIHTQGKMNVYRDDLFHPSAQGSALVAYTVFAKVFMEDVRNVKYNCAMGGENAAAMKEAAYNAVFGENPIPDSFKVSTK